MRGDLTGDQLGIVNRKRQGTDFRIDSIVSTGRLANSSTYATAALYILKATSVCV